MISRELLNTVMEFKRAKVEYHIDDNYLVYGWDGEDYLDINIHELAFKCKEWAYGKNYGISSTVFTNTDKVIVIYSEGGEITHNHFDDTTEPEAIFKACQWILEQKEQG